MESVSKIYAGITEVYRRVKPWYHGAIASQNVPETSRESFCQMFMLN